MSVSHVELLVEEPSMEAALRLLLPRLLGAISFRIFPYQGKQDLLQRLPERLSGYASFLPGDWRIVVIIDRDNDSCRDLKTRLENISANAGLTTRTVAGGPNYAVVNRIAIEELEAWYFGDWSAVRAAYPDLPKSIPSKAKYRNSDGIVGGTWEAFERILNRSNYHRAGLKKIEAAREIAPHMNHLNNTSHSFQMFRNAILEMT